MDARLSIIIPVYNAQACLDACLDSVLGQSLREIEIILVDDGSPDDCPRMCDDYAARDTRVRVIHKANAGQGYARNAGLDVATAPYVTFVDSDDTVDTDAYGRLVNLMEQHQLDMLRFECNRFKDDGTHSPVSYGNKLFTYDQPDELRELATCIFDPYTTRVDKPYGCGGSVCMAVFDRRIIEREKLRFVSERDYMSEDSLFTFMFYRKASRVGYTADTYYHYRINPESFTRSVRLDTIERAAVYCRYVEELMQQCGMPRQCAVAVHGFYVTRVRVAVKQVFLSSMTMSEKKAWFDRQTADAFFKQVMADYPTCRLTRKQRIVHIPYSHGLFALSYLLTVGFNYLRSNQFA